MVLFGQLPIMIRDATRRAQDLTYEQEAECRDNDQDHNGPEPKRREQVAARAGRIPRQPGNRRTVRGREGSGKPGSISRWWIEGDGHVVDSKSR